MLDDEILGYRKVIIDLPEQWQPSIDELPGDLRRVATTLERRIPGQGVRLTLLIAQEFPGQYVRFCNPRKFLDRWRNQVMRDRYDQGATVRALATATGLSDRQVISILNEEGGQKKPSNQLELFKKY